MKDIPVFPALRVNLLKNFLSFSRVLNKVLLRLLKNAQIQGARHPEEWDVHGGTSQRRGV